MKITFKNVGQGDSIIIEWSDCIGIIDSKSYERRNPTLEYLKTKDVKVIDFIVLSHPHNDHYSGLEDILLYCQKQKVVIKRFIHPLSHIGSQYWKWFELDIEDSKALLRIVELSHTLRESEEIERIDIVIAGWQIDLTDDISLKCLSPTHDEVRIYQELIEQSSERELSELSHAANYLSTIFKLRLGSSYVLFTSDAEIVSFQRLLTKEYKYFEEKTLQICQVPHHGSRNNHYEKFWENITTAGQKYAVFSSGKNEKYRHPHYEVVDWFHNSGYQIHATNILYGMKVHVEVLTELHAKSITLDMCSDLAEDYYVDGDKVFEYKEGSFHSK